jgi:hypothetical protein
MALILIEAFAKRKINLTQEFGNTEKGHPQIESDIERPAAELPKRTAKWDADENSGSAAETNSTGRLSANGRVQGQTV